MSTRIRMKDTKSKREEKQMRQKRLRNLTLLRWGSLAVIGVLVVGLFIWLGTRPVSALGDEVQVDSQQHVDEGSDPGPYPTDPPAGGKHYPKTYEPGFYDESDLAGLSQKYEGYLVHNLEHGYVIFWYNCAANPGLDCDELKGSIRKVMDESGSDELIAFPWSSLTEPLVMTSWGRIMRFDKVDQAKMAEFVKVNLNKSPEPDAK